MGLFRNFLNNRFVNKVLEAGDPPRRIARGVAVGSFIAVTPTVGFQIPLTLLSATILRGNRLAAVAMTFFFNPFIIIPPSYWYLPAYYIGTFLLGLEPIGLSRISAAYSLTSSGVFNRAWELLGNLWSLGLDIYGPMLVGGVVMGIPVSIVMYKVSYRIASRYKKKQTSEATDMAQQDAVPSAANGNTELSPASSDNRENS